MFRGIIQSKIVFWRIKEAKKCGDSVEYLILNIFYSENWKIEENNIVKYQVYFTLALTDEK